MSTAECQSLSDRFYSYVDFSSPNGCWNWSASTRHGYGQFFYNGKIVAAHRLSWELANGPIPDGLVVRHKCPNGDNPSCVNPAHLRLGTHQDNVNDKVEADRQVKGENIVQSKLTEEGVIAIRDLYRTGNFTQKEIACNYNMNRKHIGEIIRGNQWKHIL